MVPGIGCSLVIDVEADCDDRNCGAYVCASDGVACLDTCGGDADCSAGHICDAAVAQCIATGCTLTASAEPLDMPPLVNEMEPVWATGPGIDSQLVVFASNRHGMGLRRFSLAGAPVPNDPRAEPLGLFALVEGNELRRRFRIDAAFERGTGEDGSASRIDISFANVPTTGDVVHAGAFVLGPPTRTPSHRLAVDPGRATEILDSGVAFHDGEQAVVWSQRRAARPDVRFVLLGEGESNVAADRVAILSETDENAGNVAIAAYPGGFVVVYDAVVGADRRVVLRTLDSDGTPVGRAVISAGVGASANPIDFLDVFVLGEEIHAFWGAEADAGVLIERARLGGPELSLLTAGSAVVIPSQPLSLPVEQVTRWDAAAAEDGFGIAVHGVSRGATDVWLVRVDASGAVNPVPVGVGIDATPIEVDIAATQDGFALFSRAELDDGTAVVSFRRLVCE